MDARSFILIRRTSTSVARSLSIWTWLWGRRYGSYTVLRRPEAKPEPHFGSTIKTMSCRRLTAQGDLIAAQIPAAGPAHLAGRQRSPFDAPLREIHALAAAADGSIYAGAQRCSVDRARADFRGNDSANG